MENTKIVSIIGQEKGDFPYFLTRSLEEKKCRILVIDNSCDHGLFLSLRRADNEADYVEHGSTVYMRNKSVNPENAGAFQKFDVVILYHGLNPDYELLDMSDSLVLQTDYLPVTLQYVNDYINMEYVNAFPKEHTFVVFRDKASVKVSEDYILKVLGLTQIENEATIYYDEGNYNAYINFCYNGTQELKGISSEMRAALNMLKIELLGDEKKNRQRKEKLEQKGSDRT